MTEREIEEFLSLIKFEKPKPKEPELPDEFKEIFGMK